MKTRIDAGMLHAHDALYDTLENEGLALKLNNIDNEITTALKRLLQKRRTVVQSDKSHFQRRNVV